MNYQKVIIAGNATHDATRASAETGEITYLRFGVGVSGAQNKTTFFPVVVFGKLGEAIAPYVTKGRQILVEGRLEARDKGGFNVIADQVQLGPEPAGREESR